MERLSLHIPLAAVATAVAVGLCNCAGSTVQQGPDSPLASERILNMRQTASSDSTPDVLRTLIEQLDHYDPLVRLMAITRLEEATGETLGFRYDAPLQDRQAATQRWVDWHRAGRADTTASATEHP